MHRTAVNNSPAFHIHLVSDSTGETVASVARAALSQFEGTRHEEHIWSLVRTPAQLEKVLAGIDGHPGMVLYTLVDAKLRDRLREQCAHRKLPCVAVLAPVVAELTNFLGVESSARAGRQHELTEDYFARVEAINFALAHDDGQGTWELEDADVVLVGASRTSKSPTCIYLAYRGLKAANVPFVHGIPLPDNLSQLQKPLVIGLTIGIERLLQIRKTRLQSIDHDKNTNYVDEELVKEEVAEARRFFAKHKWPVIDVTRRSVEETAATIIQQVQERKERQLAAAASSSPAAMPGTA